MAKLESYIVFDGDCEAAFEFYAAVFGASPEFTRFHKIPADAGFKVFDTNKIMNVSLKIGDSALRGCDLPRPAKTPIERGTFSVLVNAESREQADQYFNALARDGTITMPMEDTFWGSYFGMVIDKFDIHWKVNFATSPSSPQ